MIKNSLILIVIFMLGVANGTDIRLRGMGDMRLAVPDVDAQINLYHIARNTAWLKSNDSLNWARYKILGETESGPLKRNWDAGDLQSYSLSLSGQKHLDETKIFYGDIRYNVDLHNQKNRAIDKRPYEKDPFVLADSTEGDIHYLGPAVAVMFNHHLSSSFYWGIGLDYNVNRGLKDIYTEPEIISTNICASLDMAWRMTTSLTLGLGGAAYQILDITKLTVQSDGQYPQTFRYRGLFEFRKSTGTNDRTATYKGFELCPQIGWHSEFIEGVLYFNYHYRWHELYDGTTTRRYDGYYQQKDYSFRATGRYYFSEDRQSVITIDYRSAYLEDWAKEAKAGLLINEGYFNTYDLLVGLSRQFSFIPLLAALEFSYAHDKPQISDYLAQMEQNGLVDRFDVRLGCELGFFENGVLRAGYNFRDYTEKDIWDSFGDYQGHIATVGFGVMFSNLELDLYARYGQLNGDALSIDRDKNRKIFDFTLQLKHFF